MYDIKMNLFMHIKIKVTSQSHLTFTNKHHSQGHIEETKLAESFHWYIMETNHN